jgi:hypothetical protein
MMALPALPHDNGGIHLAARHGRSHDTVDCFVRWWSVPVSPVWEESLQLTGVVNGSSAQDMMAPCLPWWRRAGATVGAMR